MLAREVGDLPHKISAAIYNTTAASEFVVGIKTSFKPNATIPILWLICTQSNLLICNTHKTRGLYRKERWKEINLIRRFTSHTNTYTVEIIYTDVACDSEIYPIDPKVNLSQLQEFLDLCSQAKLASNI